MTLPRLYAVLDVDVAANRGWTVPELARACFAGGARLVQVRGKRVPSGPLLEIVDAVMAASPDDAIVIVNDRPDVARLARAAGVHVGQEDLSVPDTRAIMGAAAIVGVSTHTHAQIARAHAEPLSYLAVGHIFPTATLAAPASITMGARSSVMPPIATTGTGPPARPGPPSGTLAA